FVDGTKIESASGRYTFVWKKSVEKNDKKLDAKLRAYIRTAERVRKKKKTDSGYPITVDKYECESCKYCRLKKRCTKAKGNRTV
ncbi:MAG: transposase, partial [Treponema sp.]|nr:transposase [Treponema sp.]